jgi:hypothetical protein
MRRVFFTCLAALSSLLFLGTVMLWRNHTPDYDVRRVFSKDRFYVIRFRHGMIQLDETRCSSGRFPPGFSNGFTTYSLPPAGSVPLRYGEKSVFGFGYRNEPLIFPATSKAGPMTGFTRSWSIPFWACAAATLVLPVLFVRASIRSKRRRDIGCSTCGYDLTGNVSGVCPECGTAVAGKVGV